MTYHRVIIGEEHANRFRIDWAYSNLHRTYRAPRGGELVVIHWLSAVQVESPGLLRRYGPVEWTVGIQTADKERATGLDYDIISVEVSSRAPTGRITREVEVGAG